MRGTMRRQLMLSTAPAGFSPAGAGTKPLLAYVHIPFCETLCPYCSFHRVRFDEQKAREYFRALRYEVERYAGLGFCFEAVYIGGGTPTVMPDELALLLARMREVWSIRHVSVETHAHHLTDSTVSVLKDACVDRLSIGVQTFDDALLAGLSRLDHLGGGARARERIEQVLGQFSTVNVDMIFNFPRQSMEMLLNDVRTVVDMGPDQVTFYPLMEGSDAFTSVFGPLDTRRERRFFRALERGLIRAGYEPVTAWCFGRGGGRADEYIVDYDEYAGLGSGAFGFCSGVLYANTFDVDSYVATLDRGELPIAATRSFSLTARVRYDLLMQLFGGGLDLKRMKEKYGKRMWTGLACELSMLLISGSAVYRGGRIVATERGRAYLVVMMREFFTGINRLREFMRGSNQEET